MNFFKEFKPWFMKAGDSNRYYMEKGRCNGQYKYEGEDCKVSLKYRTATENGLHAVWVDSKISGANFSGTFAVGLETLPVREIEGYMSDYRNCAFWCMAQFDTDFTKLHERTQGLLWKYKDGGWGFILPTVDDTYKTNLVGTDGGFSAGLTTYCTNINTCKDQLAFVCGECDDPYKLMRDCAAYAMKLLNNGATVREERRYPETFEYLGWCSWDAMEIRVSEAGLIEKCEEFKEKGIPVRWAIIDDMWAECDKLRDIPDELNRNTGMFNVMHSSKLRTFDGDPKRFPDGLGHAIGRMKDEYGLKVGMWHPYNGYWAGLDPDGELAKKYKNDFMAVTVTKDNLTKTDGIPEMRLYPKPEADSFYHFYYDWHHFLKQCGADFVKIDNQSNVTIYAQNNLAPIGKVARELHKAIESSVGAHFDSTLINCMGMANENMFNRSTGAISRCSGDFKPENREWFRRHLKMCAYNSAIQGLFYWSDWDMWWTDDAQAGKNSVLRAISGGPIYVSDKIGRSRPEHLAPLCYSDGRILRCENPALPTIDCLIANPDISGKPMKVFNTYKQGGVVAAYNLNSEEKPVKGTVSAADIGAKYDEYVIYEHFTGEVALLHGDEVLEITLKDHDDFRLYTIVPVVDGIAMIGLADKFNSPLAVNYEFDGVWSLHEGGRIAFVCADGRKRTVTAESGSYEPTVNGMLSVVDLPLSDRHIKLS
ncbi:MAG: hypothetical protein IJ428_01375 [Clostridia bacterium]|nr:hypothetical protein [Clostridia bacterium]